MKGDFDTFNSKKSLAGRCLPARTFLTAAIAVIVSGNSWGQSATSGTSPDPVALLQSISAELRALHRELVQDRREMQQHKLQDLEHELETIQGQQRQIQSDQSSRVQQAADIEAQLQQPNLTKSERDDLEAERTELLNTPPARFSSPQNALSQREAAVRDRLALQGQRMQAIEEQLRQFTLAVP